MLEQLLALPQWLTLLCTAVLGFIAYTVIRNDHKNLPPGPRGLPIIGYLPFLGSFPAQKFIELSKSYGDIVRVNAMGKSMISLNTYEAIKECLSTKGEQFSGRLETTDDPLWFLTNGTGFIREEGPFWKEHRRFALHTLRDFGFGKLSLEAKVQEIGQGMVSTLTGTQGRPYDPMDLLANAAFNVILYLTTDKHFQPEHKDFKMIRRSVKSLLDSLTGFSILFLSKFSAFLPARWRPGFGVFVEVKEVFGEFIARMIKEHEETLDENSPRDYMDAYLIERKAALVQGEPEETSFTVQRLTSNVLMLLVAGTETTSNTLYWTLRIVSSRQDIQDRIHKELDEVVGRERLPSILDRPSLPYTEALILEILRYTSIAPLAIPHTNPAPATLMGYDIPARSLLMPNIYAVHNDPRNWTDPDKFDPDRFMDPETRNKRRERVISFSIGKRSCLGESLARMELFLFLTMLLQKFQVKPQAGDGGDIHVKKSLIRRLEPFQVYFIPRK